MIEVAPARERGLKYSYVYYTFWYLLVAPARERGLKYDCICRCETCR